MKISPEKLKEARKNKGWTQAQLASSADVPIATIKNVETGRRDFPLDQARRVFRALDIQYEDVKYNKTIVISACASKGGCGKTSILANLAYSLVNNYNKKILLIDTDHQMNLTVHVGVKPQEDRNFYNAFMSVDDIRNHIIKTEYPNLDIVTAHPKLITIESEAAKRRFQEHNIKMMLEPLIEEGTYEFIFIDTAPSLGLLNTGVLFATDEIISPVEPTEFGIMGIDILRDFVIEMKKFNKELKFVGIVLNKINRSEKLSQIPIDIINSVFGDILLDTYIPQDATIKNAQMAHQLVGFFDKSSRASEAFNSLAKEVLDIVEKDFID